MIDYVHKLLGASTGDLEEADCNLLAVITADQERPLATEPAPFRIVPHGYGWFIHVRSAEEVFGEMAELGFGSALQGLYAFAQTCGCRWINLDQDADLISALPQFNW